MKVLLFLVSGVLSCMPSAFAIEKSGVSQQEGNIDLNVQGLCTIHVAYGNMHLINHEFISALADFEKGAAILAQSNQFLLELKFFVSFGKVIAYDNLHLEYETRTEIENLLCILHACEIGIGEDVDLDDSCSEEYNEVNESLKELAKLACTIEVRESLLAIINEMSSVIFADNYYDSICYSGEENSLINQDLGLFKQARKIAKKIYKVCTIIIRVIDLLEKLEKAITS